VSHFRQRATCGPVTDDALLFARRRRLRVMSLSWQKATPQTDEHRRRSDSRSANALDDLDQLVASIAVLACKPDELARL
jgi:hypothetical protein